MPHRHSPLEVEIKLRLPGAARGRRLLRAAGYRVTRRRLFESNTVYDRPGGELRLASELLRLRSAGNNWVLTYKGPPIAARHKTRPEFEVTVSDGATLDEILQRLGFVPAFRYEKFRTEFKRANGAGVVVVDETPIGTFLELEGPADWIDSAAAELGFQESDYVTQSYAGLYLEDCQARGIAAKEMVFGAVGSETPYPS